MIRRFILPALLLPVLIFFLRQTALASEEELPLMTKIGGEFTLNGPNGKKLSLSDFKGKVVLLTFGYTHCPDICPTILVSLKSLLAELGPDTENFRVLFTTVDPERDTPELLSRYVSHFGKEIIGLHGTMAEIKKVAKMYKSAFMKRLTEDPEVYFVAHTDFIYLIDDQGRTRAVYHHDENVNVLARDVRQLLRGGTKK